MQIIPALECTHIAPVFPSLKAFTAALSLQLHDVMSLAIGKAKSSPCTDGSQPTTGVDDLAKESGMENPGEGRYKIPSASLSSSAFASNQHSRRQTVSVRCSSTAQAVLPVRRHATAAPSRTCARIAVHKLAMPLSTAPGSCRQASMLR